MIHISKEARQQRSRGKQRRQPQCDQRGFYLPSSTTSKRRTNRGTEVSTQSHKGKSNVISGASLVIIIHSQTRHTISGTGASTYCNNGQHNVIRSDLLPLIIHNSKEDPRTCIGITNSDLGLHKGPCTVGSARENWEAFLMQLR